MEAAPAGNKGNPEERPKEILIANEEGEFEHDTGDTYVGWFEARKKDMTIRMQGFGTYTTAEGDQYIGQWESNNLAAHHDATVIYKDGSQYIGPMHNCCYSGKGRYIYHDGSVLHCDFSENFPVGQLTLRDPNDHVWLGKMDAGFAWFEPINHFYDILDKPPETHEKPTSAKKKDKK